MPNSVPGEKGGDAFRVVICVTSFHNLTIPTLKAFMYFGITGEYSAV